MILTGTTAVLFFGSTRIGKCRSISLDVEREALQTTKQGDLDRTYIAGLRGTQGSASLFYDPDDTAVAAILTKVYADDATTSTMDLVFDWVTDKKVTASVILTNLSVSASYGAAQVCEIQFQVSGKPTTVL